MGAEGCRAPSRTHNQAKTGASRITQRELTDWNQAEGNGLPKCSFHPNKLKTPSLDSVRLVSWSAKSEMVEPACSKMAQKMMAARENTSTAAMRLLSGLLLNPNQRMAA